jgi:enamine deaminase RidA (YjgF/YER057c/UK114 family)
MTHTLLNPSTLHDPVPMGYSHTARVPAGSDLVVVAGQWGSDAAGDLVEGGLPAQVAQAFTNLGLALSAHDLGPESVVQLRTYVVDHDLAALGVVGETVGRTWGATPPPHTVLGVASLAVPGLLVEVEALAVRG